MLYKLKGCEKKIRYFFLYLFLLVNIIFTCASAQTSTQIKLRNMNSIQIDTWQTYCASEKNYWHSWQDGVKREYQISELPRFNNNFHSGYGFIKDGNLYFRNLGTGEDFLFKKNSFKKNIDKISCPNSSWNGYVFKHDKASGIIKACTISHPQSCVSITVFPKTSPYVYAEANNAVIAITNFGDAVIFRDGHWCRTVMINDVYSCSDKAIMLTKPREIQFYSSIKYQNKTLVGEWPTGRIYEFDGYTLKVSSLSPPQFSSRINEYEAQSMANYCGDLFVGYWPYGEIMRMDGHTKKWSLFTRLFSNPQKNISLEVIPYKSILTKSLAFSDLFLEKNKQKLPDSPYFLGQRITSLITYEKALYAVTSNLRSWTPDISINFLTLDQISEYGKIYKISSDGCITTHGNRQKIN